MSRTTNGFIRRICSAALLLFLLSLFGGAGPAHAGAWDCKSSGYACTPGYTGSNSSSTWAWAYYGGSIATTTTGVHNCTLYAAYRLAQAGLPNPGRAWGNAGEWGTRLGYSSTPAVGSIAWWAPTAANPYGHVGIVDALSGGSVFVRADNYSAAATGGYTSAGWIPTSSVSGYIHLRDQASGFSTTFVANTDSLWNIDGGGVGDLGLGVMPGTSASIAKLAGGGYQIAFQANTGMLWTTGAAGTKNWGLGMKAGTSPGIAGLAAGGYQVVFQANTGKLWSVGDGAGSLSRGDRGWGMAAGSSPAIAALPSGGFEVAFQANTGNLWVVGDGPGAITRGDWGLGMKAGTSPGIAGLAAGGYQVVFQANTGKLWSVGDGAGSSSPGDRGLGMSSATSPGIAG